MVSRNRVKRTFISTTHVLEKSVASEQNFTRLPHQRYNKCDRIYFIRDIILFYILFSNRGYLHDELVGQSLNSALCTCLFNDPSNSTFDREFGRMPSILQNRQYRPVGRRNYRAQWILVLMNNGTQNLSMCMVSFEFNLTVMHQK